MRSHWGLGRRGLIANLPAVLSVFIILMKYLFPLGPVFEHFVFAVATDEFLGLRVVYKGHAAAETVVVLGEQFGVFFVMPGFQFFHFEAGFLFQTLYERLHFVAMGAFGAVEEEQVRCWIGHGGGY